MSKELYMAAQEELVARYMDLHPECSWEEAADRTAEAAYDLMRDRLADAADHARDIAKEKRNGV